MKFKYNGNIVAIRVTPEGKKYDPNSADTASFVADLALAAMHASTFQACQGNKPSSDFYFELAETLYKAMQEET